MLTKPQVIDAIMQVNRSADAHWLRTFATSALRCYLDRLELTLQPRGLESCWTRPPATSAVVTRPARV